MSNNVCNSHDRHSVVCLLPDSSNLGQNKKHFKVLSGSEYSRALQQHRSLSALLIQAVLAHNILRIPSRSFFARSLTKSTHNLYEKRLLLRVTFDEKFRTLFYNFISNPRRSQNHFIPELILFIFIYFFFPAGLLDYSLSSRVAFSFLTGVLFLFSFTGSSSVIHIAGKTKT